VRVRIWVQLGLVALLVVCGPTWVSADEAKEPEPCAAPEYSQFDFWVGEWRVTDSEGRVVGHNTIDKILDGCVLRESWTGASGMRGTSLNIYSQARGAWHQTWVDSNGLLLELDGGLVGDHMVLKGENPARDGAGTLLHEISWQPLDDGRVRQTWKVSKDGGASWQEVFDGFYAKK
jgi:hypothetical protein